MTIPEVLTESARLGIRLEVREDRLRYEAPKGAMTPALRATLVRHKADLITVLSRLEGMRRLAVIAPRAAVYARASAQGGPGRCFSCGDSLEHPAAYGRCTPCDVAADAFYTMKSSGGDEVIV